MKRGFKLPGFSPFDSSAFKPYTNGALKKDFFEDTDKFYDEKGGEIEESERSFDPSQLGLIETDEDGREFSTFEGNKIYAESKKDEDELLDSDSPLNNYKKGYYKDEEM